VVVHLQLVLEPNYSSIFNTPVQDPSDLGECLCEDTSATCNGVSTNAISTTTPPSFYPTGIPLDSSDWCTAGAATIVTTDPNALQIIFQSGYLAGAAYMQTPYDIVTNGFTLQATVQILNDKKGINPPHAADGFTVIVQQDPAGCAAVGGIGINLGYGGIKTAFVVEFDAYQNVGSPVYDPDDHHIAVQASTAVNAPITVDHHGSASNSVIEPISVIPYIDVYDETVTHTIFVQYVASTTSLTVIYDGLHVINSVNIGPAISNLALNSALVGFTAGTGADFEQVIITNVQFTNT